MRSKRQRRIDDLRRAIDCLPERTKIAMLDGIAANTIIVGAYTDRRGGVCPMLAAHRNGGRTDLIAFAHAWDRFTHAGKRSRPATTHELAVLKALLDASLLAQHAGPASGGEFGAVIADHQQAARTRRAAEAEHLDLDALHAPPVPLAAPADEREHELV